MIRSFETDLHIGIASVLPRQVGDYWEGVADERNSNGGPIFVWYVRTRTGTFVRQCEGDAAQLAKSAIKELLKHDRKKQQSHQEQVEGIMEDMLAAYLVAANSSRHHEDTVQRWLTDVIGQGDIGDNMVDESKLVALCRMCHGEIHLNPARSRAEGWLISKLKGGPNDN